MVDISIENLSWAPPGSPLLLENITCDIPAGTTLGIIGPNGAGKSSLLRCLYRVYQPVSGRISIAGVDIKKLSSRQLAQTIAAVLQETPPDFCFTVRQIIEMGRIPYQRMFDSCSEQDEEVVSGVVSDLDLVSLQHRYFHTLSGGEKQRVLIARALAQQPKLLILDEPTNHLDIRHQLEILDLVADLDITVIVSLHDLNLAARYCDTVAMIDRGRLIKVGEPREVLSTSLLQNTFQVEARRLEDHQSNDFYINFHSQKITSNNPNR